MYVAIGCTSMSRYGSNVCNISYALTEKSFILLGPHLLTSLFFLVQPHACYVFTIWSVFTSSIHQFLWYCRSISTYRFSPVDRALWASLRVLAQWGRGWNTILPPKLGLSMRAHFPRSSTIINEAGRCPFMQQPVQAYDVMEWS